MLLEFAVGQGGRVVGVGQGDGDKHIANTLGHGLRSSLDSPEGIRVGGFEIPLAPREVALDQSAHSVHRHLLPTRIVPRC